MAAPNYTVTATPFPALSKSSTGFANDSSTTVTSLSFNDRLVITISQSGQNLAHWVHVPLSTASADPMNPGAMHGSYQDLDGEDANASDLLPRSDLTATTVLGGTKRDDEVVGQTLATTIASAVLMKRPREERLLVLGLGLQSAESIRRKGYEDIVGLHSHGIMG